MHKFSKLLRFIVVLSLMVLVALGCSKDEKDNPVAPKPDPAPVVENMNVAYYYYVDLDSGAVDSLTGWPGMPSAEFDFHFGYVGLADSTNAFVALEASSQAADLPGRTFESVTRSDTSGAVFSSSGADGLFDSSRVILLKTDLGNIYKMGKASEDDVNVRVNFQYAKLSN